MSGQVCNTCDRDMMLTDGCIEEPFKFKGVSYPPIKFGEEKNKALRLQLGEKYEAFMAALIKPDRCPDCNCQLEEFHHPGCDQEECPKCGFQAIGCECSDPQEGV